MANTIERYLSLGLDRKMAEYFAAGKHRIVAVSPNTDFTLTIRFDNGEQRLYDMRPHLQPGTVFAPLLQWETFRRAYVDDCHAIAWDIDPAVDSDQVWSNKIDLCPDSCYIDSIPTGGTANA